MRLLARIGMTIRRRLWYADCWVKKQEDPMWAAENFIGSDRKCKGG